MSKESITLEEAFKVTVKFLRDSQESVGGYKVRIEHLVNVQNYGTEEELKEAFNELLEFSRKQ